MKTFEEMTNEELVIEFQKEEDENIFLLLSDRTEKMMWKIGHKMVPRNSDEEILQVGRIALLRCLRNFDASKGCKLSTYLMFFLKDEFTDLLIQGRMVRVPNAVIFKMKETMEKCTYGVYNVLSLDTPVSQIDGKENDDVYLNLITDPSMNIEKQVIDNSERERLLKNILKLRPREILILKMRYGFEGNDYKSLEEIGNMFHLTRERIRMIEQEALKKLRKYYLNEKV